MSRIALATALVLVPVLVSVIGGVALAQDDLVIIDLGDGVTVQQVGEA